MSHDLGYFKQFMPKKDDQAVKNMTVWSYTRVSSKEQFDKNSSIENQIEANRAYAKANKYEIVEEFGGTYESAKKDDFRPEFKRLIQKVEASRKRPFAIIVFKMSRFSRSGASAIGLVEHLVNKLGVALIEVSSGHSTLTPRGEMAIIDSLAHAKKENLERLDIIIPFMKAHLKNGKRFGACPPGYDHYGPRVADEKFYAKQQRIVINEQGEALREAWAKKLTGRYSDAQLIGMLETRGLTLTHQQISKIWRNPFYCGINISKMLDTPVKGNWPALISIEVFQQVQRVLEGNTSAYQHKKDEELRPLNRHIKCGKCKSYMLGYYNKKKSLHYYRCRHCKGINVNANTTPQAKRKGLNDLFFDFLHNFTVAPEVAPLVKMQLTRMFTHFNQGKPDTDPLKKQLAALEEKRENLLIRHGMDEVSKEVYEKTMNHINEKMAAIRKELDNEIPQVLNLGNLLEQSFYKLENLGLVWTSSDLDGKRTIQKTIFPEGVLYDPDLHGCRTHKINEFVSVSAELARVSPEKEKENLHSKNEDSLSVAGSGGISNQILQDLVTLGSLSSLPS